MNSMKKASLFLIFLVIVLSLAGCNRHRGAIQGQPADPHQLPDLVGTYGVNGVDPAGENYGGTLTIQAGEQPHTYHLQWIVTGAIQEGDGQVQGNQLIGQWHTLEGILQARGAFTYTITTLGELDGQRSVEGFPHTGWEKAFPNDENWGKFKLGH